MKKHLLHIILALGAVLLVGCGGGGGATSSSGTLVYEGKTDPADLDLNGVKALVEDVDIAYGDMISLADNTDNKIEMKTIATTQHFKKVEGDISGTVDTEEEYVDELTTKTTMIFTDFNDGDEIINGKIIFVKSYNRSLYDDANLTEGGVYLGDIRDFYVKKLDIRFEKLNIKDSESDITMQGSLVKGSEGEGKSLLTQNMIVKNNTDNQMIKLENFIIDLDQYERALSYSGRIYDSENGYIDVSTPSELKYDAHGRPAVGGIIKYEGKETVAFEKIAYENSMRIEIDDGKDGTIDMVEVYHSETLEVIPNRKPVINIIFPQSIYTDTDMSEVQVNVYDPDLDGLTTVYEWTVDGTVKGSQVDLDNTLFRKHETLKLTVSATDDRIGDIKSNAQFREQEVLNSRLIITANFEKLEMDLGDISNLEYTVTDADNDEITVSWKHYFVYGQETIDEYYNPVFASDCAFAIEEYDREHPSAWFETLPLHEQEDLNQTWCGEDVPGKEVNYNFVNGKTFEAIGPGLYFHEMIADDGEYNRTKVFDSNIAKSDIIESQENNHEESSYGLGSDIYMKDFDNDGHLDLIYMGSVNKHDNGSSFTEPSGEVITMEPLDYKVPALVIEYRNGHSILNKVIHEIDYIDLDKYFVNDYNGDGRLDIILTYSNGYSPPTNKTYGVMLQDINGSLQSVNKFDLENHDALLIDNFDEDKSDDIIALTINEEWNEVKQVWDKHGQVNIYLRDKNMSINTNIPESYGSDMLLSDLDENGKKDIILVHKGFDYTKLTFSCTILSQDLNGTFSENKYSKFIGDDLNHAEYIRDIKIADMYDIKDLFVVTTTHHIYMLELKNNDIHVIKQLDYPEDKSKLSTYMLPPADIDHDGKKDLIVLDTALYSDPLVGIFIQRDNLDFFMEQDFSFDDGYSNFINPGYAFGDIDVDGKYELFFNTGAEELSKIYFK